MPVWLSAGPTQPGTVNGPLTVNCRSETPVAPSTSTIEFGGVITTGALITACSGCSENSVRLSFVMRTCSAYVPGQTLMLSPASEAATAAWIDVNCAFGHCAPSSSTI